MPRILAAIPQQRFEYIRDRILAILLDEFEGQYLLTYDPELDIGIYRERATPFDKTELSALNISFASGNFANKGQGSDDGTYTYHIDIYTGAASTSAALGDTISMVKLQKLLGVAIGILEDPQYKTLGVAPPFIMKRFVSEVNVATPAKDDAANVSMGRITFVVVADKTNALLQPVLIQGFNTTIKIDNSGKGYFYEGVPY